MGQVANVALSDSFNTWRLRSNESFTNLFEINPSANTLSANSIAVGGKFVANTTQVRITAANTSLSGDATLAGANTDIRGGRLLVTSNTRIDATTIDLNATTISIDGTTVTINGAAPGTDDNALAFAIALG